MAWLDRQSPDTLYITSVNVAELLTGVELLPQGKRRIALERALAVQVLPLFEGRILVFDRKAAECFAQISAATQAAGNAIGFADGAIAAMAKASGFAVATRNLRDFRHVGVSLINPWDE